MKIFDQVSLYLLVLFAILGMATPFALAAKNRKPLLAVVAVVIFAWIAVVLIYAAVNL